MHHSQQAFCEQAFRPVPQENSLFVEQAGKPVADARCLFHKKIHSLWNRPESLLLTMVQDFSYT
ncbi:MAG: hypothetical protein EAZ18_16820 [Oscillatoriales cyanobacterium]|nr:MAG: hypothetical protein EAZ18_16820 [Oscillatoriales cyanobacterium]